ncbi:MAG TPA: MFS transporter [Pirellulaceae bacterium]
MINKEVSRDEPGGKAKSFPVSRPPRSEPPSPQPAAPVLMRDRAFWGITATQFLGAFNDTLFKQLLLLMAIPVGGHALGTDRQGVATIVFALPFILGSGYAGYLSDRYGKRRVIVWSKVAEIVVMALGLAGFLYYGVTGYTGLLIVLFLMGLHSTFFGPGKYGILPEMLREEDLPRANGIILMTTFLAIIFGTSSAGLLKHWLLPSGAMEAAAQDASRLAWGSLICIGIAMVGTLTSLQLRPVSPAHPGLRFTWETLAVPRDTRAVLWRDRALWWALVASCVFWLVSGIAIQAVNSLGLRQLGLNDSWTSMLTAFIAVGIMAGAIAGGQLCRVWPHRRVVLLGVGTMILASSLLAITLPGGAHWLGFRGTIPVLMLLGLGAGCFAIPVQVFIQSRAPDEQKGRMIAVMNQMNFVAIFLAGIIYHVADRVLVHGNHPRSWLFGLMALFLLPVAAFYRLPENR